MVLYKGYPFFLNAHTEILTLISGYEWFMLVEVQFVLVQAWLEVLITLMSLLFVV